MNFKSEPYPKELNLLLAKAKEVSAVVLKELNNEDCPLLFDLYKGKSKLMRQNKLFESLEYLPNVYSNKSKSLNEFKGLYVFGEEINGKVIPVYVGISRVVFGRLRNHGWGKTTNTCTLAFLMAKTKFEKENPGESLRAKNVEDTIHLEPCKEKMRKYRVVLYPVKNDYDLYFLEVAISGILKTKWNSFRTH
jgi:hypothetical protein